MSTFNRKKIVIAENSKMFQELISQKLKERFLCEIEVVDTMEALRKTLRANKFDYAITALALEGSNKADAPKLMTSMKVPTFVLTSQHDEETYELISKLNIVDYILKARPENVDYLVDLIKQLEANRYENLLIVDDSSTAREAFKRMLSSLQYNIFTATNGDEALALIKEHKIKIMFTDFNMPGMNGCELIAKVRKEYSENRMIIFAMSESANDLHVTMMLKSGANDFVMKSVNRINMMTRLMNDVQYFERYANARQEFFKLEKEFAAYKKRNPEKREFR